MSENLYQAFLIKYAEIGIKGKNRFLFEDALVRRIRSALHHVEGHFSVYKEPGRIFVESLEDSYDYDGAVAALTRVFGISSICPVQIVKTLDPMEMVAAVVDYVGRVYPDGKFTFKAKCKRPNKSVSMTSPELCEEMGHQIIEKFPNLTVDVHDPEKYITLEVRERAYIYSEIIKGAGGMPVGTAGKAMSLLSGGIDSPVATWMVAKRGVDVEAIYFHAPPYTSERAKMKVVDLARIVARYAGTIRLHVINFTEIQLAIYEKCPHDELTIIMRRYMMKIAERIARNEECIGLVTGESIGQVASQTMQSLAATNAVCTMPVYRPLIAFDKQDIVSIAEKIDTFETSILPYEDCCTIFVAKHPVTKPTLARIEKSEKKLADVIDEMVEKAIAEDELIICRPMP